MQKFTKALVATALFATTLTALSPAYATIKGGGVSAASCKLHDTVYADGQVVGLLKCSNGTWVLNVKLPDPPKKVFG